MRSEFAQVRLWSRLAAAALGAAALLAMLAFMPRVAIDGGDPGRVIEAVYASLESADAQRTAEARVSDAGVASRRSSTRGDNGLDVRLWRYGARGEIVFSSAEQFERCSEARRRARNLADCPSAAETAEMRLVINEALR